jgi:hypothetical protein
MWRMNPKESKPKLIAGIGAAEVRVIAEAQRWKKRIDRLLVIFVIVIFILLGACVVFPTLFNNP